MLIDRKTWLTGIAAVLAGVSGALWPSASMAAPQGWECSYSVTPLGGRFTSTIFYSCSGRNLPETRARARSQCNSLPFCVTGACIPLNHSPRGGCRREG